MTLNPENVATPLVADTLVLPPIAPAPETTFAKTVFVAAPSTVPPLVSKFITG